MPMLIICFAMAQTGNPVQLNWKTGDVLTYSAMQKTTVEEVLPNEVTKKLQTGSQQVTMTLSYTWTVSAVSDKGVATIQKRVTQLKSETKRTAPGPDGQPKTESDVIDSTVAADREKMPFLNKVAVTAQVDRLGNVLDAKSDFGQASLDRFKTELPFRMTLPGQPLSNNATWNREFTIVLDPKYGGTGEQYPCVQTCTFKGVNGPYAVMGVSSKLKTEPKTTVEFRPLIPLLWEGEVFFDQTQGRYFACKLVAKKELKDFEGEGTKFNYQSEFVESLQVQK